MEEETPPTIPSRQAQLNQMITGRYPAKNGNLIRQESLLDALLALYDELNHHSLRMDNKLIADFTDKYRSTILDIKKLRVNIKDFDVKKIIGQGHFGEVQVVREKDTGDVYAMKVLSKSETLNQRNGAFFEEERAIMAEATSPWLTHLHYAFHDAQNLYLVMEFHPGGDLLALLEKYEDNILPEQMSHFYLAELVLAIHALHSMGYVHRDIKPDNILFDRTGHLKLADFGSASKLNQQKCVTSRMPVGTPDYIAPEVLMAMNNVPAASASYGTECDWWSLGIVAYELFYGSTPFTDDKVLVTYSNIMNFKSMLKFPTEPTYSDVALSLIRSLLQEATDRANFDSLCKHPYFEDVDWIAIRHTPPPHVPNLKGEDDTSYFDEFEHGPTPPSLNLTNPKTISGRNLPFIGFTYSNSLPLESGSTRRSKSYSILNMSSILSSTRYSEQCKGDIGPKTAALEERSKSLASQLKSAQASLQKAEADKVSLQETCARLESEIKSQKRLLELEKQERLLAEQKATEFSQAISGKHKEKEELMSQLLRTTQEQLADVTKELAFSESKSRQAAQDYQRQLDIMSQTTDSNKVSELLHQIDQLRESNLESERMLSSVVSSREHVLNEFHRLKEANLEMETEVEELRKVVAQQEDYLHHLREHNPSETESTNLEEEEHSSINNQLEELSFLISKFDEEMMNKSRLEDTIKELKDSHREFLLENEGQLREMQALWTMQIQDLDQELNHYKNINVSLEGEIKNLTAKEAEYDRTISGLKARLKELENEVSRIPQSPRKGDVLKENNNPTGPSPKKTRPTLMKISECPELESLVREIEEPMEEHLNKMEKLQQELDHLKQVYRKKEKEMVDMGLDLRLLKGQAKRAEERVATLKEMNKDLRAKVLGLENSLAGATLKEEVASARVAELEEALAQHKQKLVDQSQVYQVEKASLDERIQYLRETNKSSQDFKSTISKLEAQNNDIIKEKQKLQEKFENADSRSRELHKKNESLLFDLTTKKDEVKGLEMKLLALKNLCAKMDSQNVSLETLVQEFHNRNLKLEKDKELLKKDIYDSEEEIKSLHESLSKERKARQALEAELAELGDERQASEVVHSADLASLRAQMEYYQRISDNLNQQLTEMEQKQALEEVARLSLASKLEYAQEEIMNLKEESSRHITTVAALRSANQELGQSLEEASNQARTALAELDHLHTEMDVLEATSTREKIKFKETINQQKKLIDFLQDTLEDRKKKKIFGSSHSTPSKASHQSNYADFENALQKERARNRQLLHQLNKARAEVFSQKSEFFKTKSTPLTSSPSSRALLNALSSSSPHSSPKLRGTTERMRHSIPHRFSETLCIRPAKCFACLDTIHFGRYCSKCQDCGILTHPKCSSSVSNSCGLPPAFMKHFSETLRRDQKRDTSDVASMSPSLKSQLSSIHLPDDSNSISGWFKVLCTKSGKKVWEQRFLRIEGTETLVLSEKEEQGWEGEEHLSLRPVDGEVLVLSGVGEGSSDIASATTKEDLACVFKLEWLTHASAVPTRCLYIMAPSLKEKSTWVTCLEVLTQVSEAGSDLGPEGIYGSPILTLQGKDYLDLVCIAPLPQEKFLVGSHVGLHHLDLNESDNCGNASLEPVPGVTEKCAIHMVHVLLDLNTVVLVVGESREVRSAHLSSLDLHTPILNIQDCHLLTASTLPSGSSCLAVATPQTVFLLAWVNGNFSIVKKVPSPDEPCHCLLFTHNTLIMGMDTFKEMDLKAPHSVDDFLDMGDTSLSFLQYGAAHLKSYPINIFQVSSTKSPTEYLLCYQEFGIFVDDIGRRSRSEDIKWTRLPLTFAFHEPYLFIMHYSCIEVMEISSPATSSRLTSTFLKVSSPQYLGGAGPGAIFMSSQHSGSKTELYILHGDLMTARNHSTISVEEEDDGDGFSFTTSLNNSLAGNH